MKIEIWEALLVLAVVMNIFVSIVIAKRDDLDGTQKTFQIIIVWLIPIIASIGLWVFHKTNDEDSPFRMPFNGDPNEDKGGFSNGIGGSGE